MDLSSSLSSIAQGDLRSKIDTAVAVKAQDAARQQGEAAVSLLAAAAKVGESQNKAAGSQRIDMTA